MEKTINPSAPWLLDATLGPDTTMEIATFEQLLEDADTEVNLRPESLDDFIGQSAMMQHLRVAVEAAKVRWAEKGEPLRHILFTGGPGLGKTSLATLMAAEMGVEAHDAHGQNLRNAGDLATIISYMEDGDILFVDEVHALKKSVQEALYTALEDRYIDIVVGSGPTAKPIKVKLPRFTMIGATTDAGTLTKPMLRRFPLQFHLEPYDKLSLQRIIMRAARSMEWEIEKRATQDVARRSRGTPSKAIDHLQSAIDYAVVYDEPTLSREVTDLMFSQAGIDTEGLNKAERRYLRVLIERFTGGPVGVVNMAAALGESEGGLAATETYLIQQEFLVKMDRGRKATTKARKHLGYPVFETEERSWK